MILMRRIHRDGCGGHHPGTLANVRGLLRFHPVESVDEVLAMALEPPVAKAAA